MPRCLELRRSARILSTSWRGLASIVHHSALITSLSDARTPSFGFGKGYERFPAVG